jgi:hypothetical protein
MIPYLQRILGIMYDVVVIDHTAADMVQNLQGLHASWLPAGVDFEVRYYHEKQAN